MRLPWRVRVKMSPSDVDVRSWPRQGDPLSSFFFAHRLDKNGLLEHCCELLDDAAFLRPDLVLQLLGNVVYRNDEAICLRLLALDAFTKVLQHARFHPEAGLTREWAMVVIRNATEGQ